MFVIITKNTLDSYTLETDIFTSKEVDKMSDIWDECSPITTLGTDWTYVELAFDNICDIFVRFKVHNMWFPNVDACIEVLNTTEHLDTVCSLASQNPNGGICSESMPVFANGSSTFAVSCNGVNQP
jgi:hypothetical protein